jgi:hypothetical protein
VDQRHFRFGRAAARDLALATRREDPSGPPRTEDSMAPAARPPLDRVAERRRAAALARYYRDAEQLPIAEIARRVGRAPATVKAYLYDPTGEKARAVKARYRGYCRTCGADTSPRNGKGDAYLYCRRCRPGAAAPKWTRERVREAMRRWRKLYGAPPSSYDWSRTHARRRGAQALRRLERDAWPSPATVSKLYGSGPPHGSTPSPAEQEGYVERALGYARPWRTAALRRSRTPGATALPSATAATSPPALT